MVKLYNVHSGAEYDAPDDDQCISVLADSGWVRAPEPSDAGPGLVPAPVVYAPVAPPEAEPEPTDAEPEDEAPPARAKRARKS